MDIKSANIFFDNALFGMAIKKAGNNNFLQWLIIDVLLEGEEKSDVVRQAIDTNGIGNSQLRLELFLRYAGCGQDYYCPHYLEEYGLYPHQYDEEVKKLRAVYAEANNGKALPVADLSRLKKKSTKDLQAIVERIAARDPELVKDFALYLSNGYDLHIFKKLIAPEEYHAKWPKPCSPSHEKNTEWLVRNCFIKMAGEIEPYKFRHPAIAALATTINSSQVQGRLNGILRRIIKYNSLENNFVAWDESKIDKSRSFLYPYVLGHFSHREQYLLTRNTLYRRSSRSSLKTLAEALNDTDENLREEIEKLRSRLYAVVRQNAASIKIAQARNILIVNPGYRHLALPVDTRYFSESESIRRLQDFAAKNLPAEYYNILTVMMFYRPEKRLSVSEVCKLAKIGEHMAHLRFRYARELFRKKLKKHMPELIDHWMMKKNTFDVLKTNRAVEHEITEGWNTLAKQGIITRNCVIVADANFSESVQKSLIHFFEYQAAHTPANRPGMCMAHFSIAESVKAARPAEDILCETWYAMKILKRDAKARNRSDITLSAIKVSQRQSLIDYVRSALPATSP